MKGQSKNRGVSLFSVGDFAIYTKTKDKIKILDRHLDSPEGVYYTIKMRDGSERQTEQHRLKKIRKTKKRLHHH